MLLVKQIQVDDSFSTVKMTAAEAVEMSVTNSLSQNYTNLDGLQSLTCIDSPRFKPFTLLLYGQINRLHFKN